MLHNFGNN